MFRLVVLSCLLAAVCGSAVLPLAYTAPLAYSTPLAYSAPLAYSGYNYRGPLSLAPGQPANILGADGRPLDTLDVNLDKSAHYAAKFGGIHLLKKRSAPLYAAPLATPLLHSAVLPYSATYTSSAIATAPIAHTYTYGASPYYSYHL